MAKIAIIGSGLIGRAWAISFARAKHEIRLYDQVAGAAEKVAEAVRPGAPAGDGKGAPEAREPVTNTKGGE